MEKLIYDPDKLTILEGFGLTPERMNRLVEEYVHGSRADVISRIVNASDEDLPHNERYALLINLGVLLVGSTLDEMRIGQELTDKGA